VVVNHAAGRGENASRSPWKASWRCSRRRWTRCAACWTTSFLS
jgi:hypothetical protein